MHNDKTMIIIQLEGRKIRLPEGLTVIEALLGYGL